MGEPEINRRANINLNGEKIDSQLKVVLPISKILCEWIFY